MMSFAIIVAALSRAHARRKGGCEKKGENPVQNCVDFCDGFFRRMRESRVQGIHYTDRFTMFWLRGSVFHVTIRSFTEWIITSGRVFLLDPQLVEALPEFKRKHRSLYFAYLDVRTSPGKKRTRFKA
jgi:hypothetical protein